MKPTSEQIKEARLKAGHSQTQACAAIFRTGYRTWGGWEADRSDMDPAIFQFYLIITGQHKGYKTA